MYRFKYEAVYVTISISEKEASQLYNERISLLFPPTVLDGVQRPKTHVYLTKPVNIFLINLLY